MGTRRKCQVGRYPGSHEVLRQVGIGYGKYPYPYPKVLGYPGMGVGQVHNPAPIIVLCRLLVRFY